MSDGQGLPHVFELINFEGLHETVQVLRSELERVDELESVHSDGEILLHVHSDGEILLHVHSDGEILLHVHSDGDSSPCSVELPSPPRIHSSFDNQVPIIALEVMYDYR